MFLCIHTQIMTEENLTTADKASADQRRASNLLFAWTTVASGKDAFLVGERLQPEGLAQTMPDFPKVCSKKTRENSHKLQEKKR